MNLDNLQKRIWSLAGGVSVKVKIMGIVLALTLIFGLAITFQVRNNITTMMIKELEEQGTAIARNLAARSTDLVLTGNTFDLYQLLINTVEHNDKVQYAMVLDSNGNVLGHSFDSGVPVGLADINIVEPDIDYQIERLDTNEGLVLDLAVPIFGGRAGISRVGMSTHLLNETIATAMRQWLIIIGATAFIGLLATYILTSVLTRPILQLVEVTKAITKGDLKRKANVWASDEIGRLAISFNDMTEYLAKAKAESEVFQSELIRRNIELAALNSIANEISRTNGTADMMQRLLTKVTELMSVPAGWIQTSSENGRHHNLIYHIGLTDETIEKISNIDPSACACNSALIKMTSVLIREPSTCSMINQRFTNGEIMRQHVAVPLVSKSKVFGLLHVAGPDTIRFTSEHLKLLDAIGNQIGIALENARLWEELKQKEELRGQLLQSTISAQELERKRIARELHDQTGQALTSLMVGLKILEKDSPEKIRHKVSDMRQLTAQTLGTVHNLALELRPSSLDDLGLVAALRQYTHDFGDKFGIQSDFQTIGFDDRRLLPEVEITIYRIVQEAIMNIVKHAEAAQASVLLEIRGTSIVAIVEDNGKGFKTGRLSQSPTKETLGLYGMYERAALINGKITIESEPGRGTTLFLEVPMPKESLNGQNTIANSR